MLYYVSLGSNIEPEVHVPRALDAVHEAARIRSCSPIYETPPLNRPEQAPYWNAVFCVGTGFSRERMEALLRRVENAEGRTRGPDAWAPRTMDLDILAVDGDIVDPDVWTRPFLVRGLLDVGFSPGSLVDPGQRWARVSSWTPPASDPRR